MAKINSGSIFLGLFLTACSGMLSLPGYCQEFEIELPEGARESRRVSNPVGKRASSQSGSARAADPALKTLADAELYLYSQVHESRAFLERLDQLEITLFGQVSKGELKERLKAIKDTIDGGNAKVAALSQKSGEKSEKAPVKKRKWWQVFSGGREQVTKGKKVPLSKEALLLQEGRRYLKRKKWQEAKDRFSQVLILDAANPEALLQASLCDINIVESGTTDTPSPVVSKRLVEAKGRLEKALRLYTVSRKSEEALLAKKAIEKVEVLLHGLRVPGAGDDF